MPANRHGLSRRIPSAVQDEVRARSRYGCVICRELLCDFEHIEPEFADAQRHDGEAICLLCPTHHAAVTRGSLSKAQVLSAYETVQSDASVKPPFHQMLLSGNLALTLGDSTFEYMPNGASIIEYDGEPVLSLTYEKDVLFGGFFPSLSGTLQDACGKALLTITRNIIEFADGSIDARMQGNSIKIGSQTGAIDLVLTIEPPSGLVLDRLKMKYGEVILNFDRTFGIVAPSAMGTPFKWEMSGLRSKGATSAMSYTSDRSKWNAGELRIAGDEGVLFPHCGIVFAKGAGQMIIPRLSGQPVKG